MKMPAALLIGNDINSLSPGYDWDQLLRDLIDFVHGRGQIAELNEQFPLFYEEICIHAQINRTRTESEIKRFIADKVKELRPNFIHKEMLELGVNEVLTTNYEHTLEESKSSPAVEVSNKGVVSERRYSIFRNNEVEDVRFWHIHGDANAPNSIALGYEHYSGYLQNMRSYVVSGTKDAYKRIKLKSLRKRLEDGGVDEIRSWLDVFFTHDLHIVGLGLDFVEIHLWWLLTYRARLQNGKDSIVRNSLYYHYPRQREVSDKTKLRFLRSNSVQLQATDCPHGDKSRYYKNVIQKIKENIGSRR